MKTKHTQTSDWTAVGNRILAGEPGRTLTLATVHGTGGTKGGDWCETDEANAKLIAAAPELLAACKRASAVLEDYVHGDPADVPEMCAMAETLEDCIAAIAKATS